MHSDGDTSRAAGEPDIIYSKKEKVVVLENPTIKLTFSYLVTAEHVNTCCQDATQPRCTARILSSLCARAISPYEKASAFSPLALFFYPHSEAASEPPPHPTYPISLFCDIFCLLWHSLVPTHQVAVLHFSLPKKESVEEKSESFKRKKLWLSSAVIVHTVNLSTLEAEAGAETGRSL